MIVPYKIALEMFKDEVMKAFEEVIDSGMLILGEKTRKFEEIFSASHERKHGIAVNSDTSALEAALIALSWKLDGMPSDKHAIYDLSDTVVLMPDTAFYGCVNVALRLGAKVITVPSKVLNGVMCTVDQVVDTFKSFGLGSKKTIFMAVYTAGTTGADSVELIRLLRDMGVPTVEDCAHAHGAKYSDGRLAGSEGDIATFSFYATKMIHSGEGGMLLVDDDDVAEFLRTYRNYGKDPNGDPIFADSAIIGYNWRMTEFQAAIGSILWENYDKVYRERKKIADVYDHFFRSAGGHTDRLVYRLLVKSGKLEPNLYRYIVMVPGLRSHADNEKVYGALKARGILLQAKCNSKPLWRFRVFENHPNFFGYLPSGGLLGSDAESYSISHLCLPIYPTMSEDEAEKVAASLLEVVSE